MSSPDTAFKPNYTALEEEDDKSLLALTVRSIHVDAPDFAALVSELEADLETRYPGLSEDEPITSHGLLEAVVGYCDDTPIGCGALREFEPGVVEIKRMYVREQARGLGVARRMLEALEERGRALGFSAARLGTGDRQPEALALYRSSGYSQIPLFGEYESAEACLCFEKSLR